MKKIFLLLSLISVVQLSKAQAPNWLWVVGSGGDSYQYPNGIKVDATDSLEIAGRYAGTMQYGTGPNISGGNDNPFVAKLDSTGNGKWIEEVSYGYYDYPWGFAVDAKGNVYSSGIVSSGYEMFVEKYDRNGNLKWDPTIYGAGIAAQGMAVDGAGCVYITGSYNGSVTLGSTTLTSSGQDIFVAKLDSNGNFLWADDAGGGGGYDAGRGMAIDEFANIYVTGGYTGTATFGSITPPAATGYANLFIAEYDSSGNIVRVTTAGSAGFDNGDCCSTKGITIDSCDNLYVTGYYEGTGTFGNFSLSALGDHDTYVAKCDNAGNWQWANDIGTSGAGDYANAITLDKSGDVYVGGYFQNGSAMFGSTPITGAYYYVAKYANSNGALQWVQSGGSSANGGGIGGITVDAQKYVYIIGDGGNGASLTFGSHSITASSNAMIWIAKLDTVQSVTINAAFASNYCPGSVVTIPYTVTGTFNSGNTFTAQLSDSTGSFTTSTDIGSATSSTNGSITFTIPSGTPAGSHYLIRIVSSSPGASSYAFCPGFSIGGSISVAVTPSDTSICLGSSVSLSAFGGDSYTWSNSDTGSTILVTPVSDTTVYAVHVTNGSCKGDDSITIYIKPSGPVTLNPQSPTICAGESILLQASGYTSYTWSPDSSLSNTTSDTTMASPQHTVTYTIMGTNTSGCSATAYDTITVVPAPNVPTISQSGDTLFSSAATDNQWYLNGSKVAGATNNFLIIGNSTQSYTVSVENPADGCSSTSSAFVTSGINQLSVINSQLSVYPNPTNGNLFLNISSAATDVNDWNLRVTDVLGRTLYTRNSLSYSNELDFSTLAGGIYFITVSNTTSQGVFKVVKQ